MTDGNDGDDGNDGGWPGDDPTGFEEFRHNRVGKLPSAAEAAGLILADRDFVQISTGEFYEYDKEAGYWQPRTKASMAAVVHVYKPRFGSHAKNETLHHLGVRSHKRNHEWGRVDDGDIALANGVLNLETMRMRDHRPEDWLDYVVPHAWTSGQEQSDLWLQCVDDWLGIESAAAMAIQEFFGYVLMPHARHKKALVLYGGPDTGKSRPVAMLKTIVGPGAHCSIGVDHMDDPRRISVIKHKRVNTITELKADAMISDGGFKTLVSTEEPILIDTKFGAIETITPTCKHVIACNILPAVNDRTHATYNRLLIIPFSREISAERQDRFLDEKLAAEVAGVVAWAVEGAARLHRQGGSFTHVGEADVIMKEYVRANNPMADFISEETVPDSGAAVPLTKLVERYNKKRYGRPITAHQVGGWLRQIYGKEAIRTVRYGRRTAVSLVGRRLVDYEFDLDGDRMPEIITDPDPI